MAFGGRCGEGGRGETLPIFGVDIYNKPHSPSIVFFQNSKERS